MTIRKKTIIITCLTFFILMALIIAISRIVISRGFRELETKTVERNVNRVIQGISEVLSNLSATAADWALWDDTYKFIKEHNEDYVTRNLMYDTLITLKINFMLFIDIDNHLVDVRHIDLANEKATTIPDDLLEKVFFLNNFLKPLRDKNGKTGIIMVGEMPALVSFKPILKSDHSGPVRGILVMGK